MTIEEIRRERLIWIRDNKYLAKGKAAKQLADDLGVSPAQLSQWLSEPGTKGRRNISTDTARAIEKKVRMPKEWLDGVVAGSAPELSPQAQRLGRAFDEIKDATAQNALFVKMLEELERAATEPVPPADRLVRRTKTRPASHK